MAGADSRLSAFALRLARLVVGLVALGCAPDEGPTGITAPPVEVAAVEARTVIDRILVAGELLAVNEASVAAEVDGSVTAILVEEGAPVERGDVVFEIDRERRDLELRNAQARMGEARARLQQHERESERIRKLHARDTASEASLDTAEADLRLARSGLAGARAELGLAERALRKAAVVAPFSGIVARRHVTAGEFVTPGRELFDLVSLDPIEIEFRVPERDSHRIEMELPVGIRVAPFPGEVFPATITMISPRIDPSSRTLRVKARITKPDRRLRPGLFARADLGVSERVGIAMVPEGAILQRADGAVAFRLVDGPRVERVTLVTGVFRDGYVELLDGLQVGDTIVIRGHARLVDGSVVEVRTRAGQQASASSPGARRAAK